MSANKNFALPSIHRINMLIIIGTCVLLLMIPGQVNGQAEGERVNALQTRMQELKQQNEDMKGQMGKQQEYIEALKSEIEGLKRKDQDISQEVENVKREPVEGLAELAGPVVASDTPKVSFNGFGEVAFTSTEKRDENSSAFSIQEADFLFNAELHDRVSFLLDVDSIQGGALTVQRIFIKYSLSDLLNIKFGKMETPLGYWNEAYHHATYLQTSVARPEIYRLEANSGVLPLHAIGINFNGNVENPWFDTGYDLGVFNGRGTGAVTQQNTTDANDSKAVNMVLRFKPHAIEGLDIGPTVYWDTIPSVPTTASRKDQINELIMGTHAVYQNHNIELLAEWLVIHHNDRVSATPYNTEGGYIQGAYQMGKWKPYYRWGVLNVGDGEPYFTGDVATDRVENVIGVRWDLFKWNAIKFEIKSIDNENADDQTDFILDSSVAF